VKSLRFTLVTVMTLALVGVPLLAARKAERAEPAAQEPPALKAFGSKGAPITMEIFSDFQCPACRTLYESIWHPLMDNYVDTGRVYLIHRDMPLAGHAYSRLAAQYADAAARIGRFEKVEDVLFTRQNIWEQSGDVDGVVASVLTPAEMAKVRRLVKSPQVDAAIDRDVALGQDYRVTQTPTIIITCKGKPYPVVGAVSYSILRQFLDQLLSQR
jgi:protein-disulfide isomerase